MEFFKKTLAKLQLLYYKYCSKVPPREKKFYNYNDMLSVLLIFESAFTERNETIKQAVAELQHAGKRVAAWGYVDKDEVTSATVPSYRVLGKKDLNLLGRPKAEVRAEFEEQQFDTIIDLTTRDVLPLKWLIDSAHANFRIGRKANDPFYDFVIDIPDDKLPADIGMGPDAAINVIWTEVEKYLKMIG